MFVDEKNFVEKSWKNIFSSKTKNSVLRLKHIQRTTSNFISKCSHVSISHIFTKISDPMAPPDDMLYSSIIFQNVVFIFNWKWRQIFLREPEKQLYLFWKTKFLLRAKSIVSALELPFQNTVKHQKRAKTRKVILKKTEGWAFNSWTQFTIR